MTEPIPDDWADKLNETMRGRAAVYGKPVEPGPLREDTNAARIARGTTTTEENTND